MLRNCGLAIICIGIVLAAMLPVYSYPENYAAPKSGASISSPAKLIDNQDISSLLSDDPVNNNSIIFADIDQQQVLTVDLGKERTFDRVFLGTDNKEQPRCIKKLQIQVSSKGADGPYKTIFTKDDFGWQQVLRLPLTKARWVRFDMGSNVNGYAIRGLSIYKGYEHPKLIEVTKLLHERIAPNLPGLEKFYAAADAKDWKTACKELRAYYAKKIPPDGRTPNFSLSMARDFEKGILDFAGISRIEKVPIDWSYQATTDWYEHKNFLNRGAPLGRFLDAYHNTGDIKWAILHKQIFYDWIDANPKPDVISSAAIYPTWRTLDSACRSAWFTTRFAKSTHGKAIDDELWANTLFTIWEHADLLRKDNFTGGNWMAMTTSAVMDIALNYPEFKDQKEWLEFGKYSFEMNVLRDILPDGKEIEDAPGYNCMAYNGMFGTMMALEKAGVTVDPEAKNRLNEFLSYIGPVVNPNGNFQYIGDSGGGPIPYDLYTPAKYFNREDTKYILTLGKEGTPPAVSSICLPYGKWVIMRSPYDEKPFEDARHLIFKYSWFSHGHPDIFNVVAYAYGRELLIDPGIRSYEGADVERYLQTSYHNTICIDNKNVTKAPAENKRWVSNAGIDYALAGQQLYKGLYSQRSVTFIRPEYWIVHDDITGEGTHTYDQNWHFPADAGIVEDASTKAVRTSYPSGGNLIMVPIDPETMKSESKDFFIAVETNNGAGEVASKGWKYSREGVAPQVFDTVLYPYKGAAAPKISAKRLVAEGIDPLNVTALEIKANENTDYVVISRTGAQKMTFESANLFVDGEIAVVRVKDGKPVRVSGANLKSITFGGKSIFSSAEAAADVDVEIKPDDLTEGNNNTSAIKGVAMEDILKPYSGPVNKGVDTKTLTGKVMCGYQGWFAGIGDGADVGWFHWGLKPGGKCSIDMWPDMSELDPDERYVTDFKHADGRPAEVFSSFNKKTVVRHFKWMQDYGIDGVFVQRFASQVGDPVNKRFTNTVLSHCREGANTYGRTYAVMYDMGFSADTIERVMNDWKELIDKMQITSDPAYLHHNGKPVVTLWGFGFSHYGWDADAAQKLLEMLTGDTKYGGCTVMLGLPTSWRNLQGDCREDKKIHELMIKYCSIVSPWTVGRYGNLDEVENHARTIWADDFKWCREHGKDYLPVVFPGFSWHNLIPSYPTNQIPRLGGRFLWKQYTEAKKLGATMIYQAMFDEVDEGTAIFKVTNDPPVDTAFVTLEGLPSDHYLKLVGKGGQLLRDEIELTEELPK